MRHFVSWLFVLLLAICSATPAAATTVPVEVASGPSFFNLDRPQLGGQPNALAADQPWHFGWRLELAAIIDEEWAEKNPGYVPDKYRSRLKQLGEVKYSPAILGLIPRSLFISPKFWNTGIYGATWEFLHAGVGASFGEVSVNVGAGAIATYTFLHSDTLSSPFHFLRPGLDLGAHVFVPFGEKTGLSFGWDSHMYIPQRIGGGLFEIGGPRENLWHIGEAFVAFHYRFPYKM